MPSLSRLAFALTVDGLVGAGLGWLASEYLPLPADKKDMIFYVFLGVGLFIGLAHAILYPKGRPVPW
ncbi:MAG: hypothetical protein HZC25_18425 [Rhodospirillales bacterium]|nr:hypothetical protein [Rhodospirillales bacterium]